MQINADKGGSLFGNITLPNKKEDLQKQNDPLIQPAIFPQAPTNNPFPQSIEKPK